MDPHRKILRRLKNHIKADPDLNQKIVASRMGKKEPTISGWLSGKKPMRFEYFIRLCEACNLHPSDATQTAKGKGGYDLALVKHIDMIRMFQNKRLALEVNKKLLTLEKRGQLDMISVIIDGMLSHDETKASDARTRTKARG